MGGNTNVKVGPTELFIFLMALVAGTGCSLCSKIMLDMEAVGMTGEIEKFSFPLFQTFGMFIGMTAGLLLHFLVLTFKIPFPGYQHKKNNEYTSLNGKQTVTTTDNNNDVDEALPLWVYFALIVPSIFDLIATSLCMFGLRYINVSIYQMLRGGAIVFVAILKHFMLGDKLKTFMWIGVFWNVVSIVLVGGSAMFSTPDATEETQYNNPALGVLLVLLGAFVQSLQYAFEEKVMTMDVAAPPLLLIGMEGLWGSIICLFILYPLAYYMPGPDHGSFENPFNTLYMFQNSQSVQGMFWLYFCSIFFYNTFAVLVTYMLNSVWHAILDNFRPITVWITDLVIFYFISQAMGEAWTVWSWMQLGGMIVLLYGTAVYNAPNPGSLRLEGGALNCCLDFTHEYEEIEAEEAEAVAAAENAHEVGAAGSHAVFSTMSPFMSPRVGSQAFSTPIGMTPRTSRLERMRWEEAQRQQRGAGAYQGYGGGYGSTSGVGMVPLRPDGKQASFA